MQESINNPHLLILRGHDALVEFGISQNPNTIDPEQIENVHTVYDNIIPLKFSEDITIKQSSDFKMSHIPHYVNGNIIIFSNDTDKTSVFASIGSEYLNVINLFSELIGVNGSIHIIGTSYREITGFDKLQYVTGDIIILDNPNLCKIPTFSSLISTNKIIISNNSCIDKIIGFEKIKEVINGIHIIDNKNLIDICGFTNLISTMDLLISSNPKLKRIIGFSYLENIKGNFFISSNNKENDTELIIDAFHHVSMINKLFVGENYLLRTIEFPILTKIDNSITISGNPDLISISMESLIFSGDIIIQNNNSLEKINFNRLIEINGKLIFAENASFRILSAFPLLKKIHHALIIIKNKSLEIISGLHILNYIGISTQISEIHQTNVSNEISILIDDNQNLHKIDSFHSLRTINGNIHVFSNPKLQFIFAFDEVEHILDMYIKNNSALSKITGFNKLSTARDIIIFGAPKLLNIESLSELKTCQHIYFEAKNPSAIESINDRKKMVSGFLIYFK